MTGPTVLVCGSRAWQDRACIRRELEKLPPETRIVHGGAVGADQLAGEIALSLGYEVVVYAADWETEGRRAGMLRNQRMLDVEHPSLVLAFQLGESAGTQDMVVRASKAGCEVRVFQVF